MMNTMRLSALGVLVAVSGYGLAGCGPTDDVSDLEDEGTAYLRPADFDRANGDGFDQCPQLDPGPTKVEVVFNSCASSTCTSLEDASCSATVDGNEIVVTSEATIRNVTRGACSDDCMVLSTSCDVGTLEEGTYTIVHGDDTRTVELPSEDEACVW